MIYSFYIFDRHCSCIYSREYSHLEPHSGSINKNNLSDTSQLLFGILYSLKLISAKLIDNEDSAMTNSLKSFTLGTFRCHYLESLTGLKFVLTTDVLIDNLQNILWELYSNYYLNNVVRNGFSPVEFKPESEEYSKINNSSFITQTDAFLESLPSFSS